VPQLSEEENLDRQEGSVTPPAAWLVDAHVHIHPSVSVPDAFAAAAGHFRRWQPAPDTGGEALGCLLLAERQGEDCFRRLRTQGLGPRAGGWTVHPTREDTSLVVRFEGEPRFVLVSGRQIVTAERLEVLALGTASAPADGEPLERALDRAEAEQALAVIPWGFGKWWGRRGARLARLIAGGPGRRTFLGDNGGRPRLLPDPPLLRRAASRGVWNLPGSDPLPLPGEVRRTGSYGFVVPAAPDLDLPFAQIRDAVTRSTAQPRLYGRRAPLRRFIAAQAALRLRREPGTPRR
jgi:hypothetical protein